MHIRKTGNILSLLAVLFIALGPVFAPVLSLQKNQDSYIEICTSYGLIKKALSEIGTDTASLPKQDQKSHKANRHCLFCGLRSWVFLVPEVLFLQNISGNLPLWTVAPFLSIQTLTAVKAFDAQAPPFIS